MTCSEIDRTRETLANVIKLVGADPRAALTPEAIAAAAVLEAADLGDFARYRRNLRDRHVSLSLLDQGLRRFRTENDGGGIAGGGIAIGGVAGGQSPACSGQPVRLFEPEPWPDVVDGAALLDELVTLLKRYFTLPPMAAEAIALWIVHTYCMIAFDITPRLFLSSPVPRCGKTRLLEVLKMLCWRGLSGADLTASAIFRSVESWQPTLLFDEVDLLGNHANDFHRILNSGWSRGGSAVRVKGEQLRVFETFAPVVYAGIGKMRDTAMDRSIVVHMPRRKPSEATARLTRRARQSPEFEEIPRRCRRWADENIGALDGAEPQMPALDERAADSWEPLVSIAEAAGPRWGAIARTAATTLSGPTAKSDDSEDDRLLLLGDLRDLFVRRGTDRLRSEAICKALAALAERPWGAYGGAGKEITQHQLAKALSPFKIKPDVIRFNDGIGRGYKLDSTTRDAFSRYVLPLSPIQTVTP